MVEKLPTMEQLKAIQCAHESIDDYKISHNWGNDEVIHPNDIFLNKVTQKTIDDLSRFFMARFGVKNKQDINLSKRKELWDEVNYEKHLGKKPEIKDVKIENIIPSQNYINKTTLGEYVNSNSNKIPLGVSVPNSDKIVLFDGHHTVASDIINGKNTSKISIIPTFGLFKHIK